MIHEKQEGIKPFSVVTHPPVAPTTLIQEMPWSSWSAQGHPWSQRQSFKISSQAVLLTTLSLINCVYSGATKDGWRSANPLPRKIFSTEIIVIKSEGKHWQKLAENQHVHLSEGCGAEKNPSAGMVQSRRRGGGLHAQKSAELLPDFPSSSVELTWWHEPTAAGINKRVCFVAAPSESREHTFTLSETMPPRLAEGSPSPAGSSPAAIVDRPPALGRKGKSALNQCVPKEVSGKNTSAARMLSNFFFFSLFFF